MLFSCGRMSAYRHVAFKSLNIVLLSRFEWLDKKENLNVEMPTYARIKLVHLDDMQLNG